MGAISILCVSIIAVYIAMTTAQPQFRSQNGRGPRWDSPPQNNWHSGKGPCRLTDVGSLILVENDCLDGTTCTVGPVELTNRGSTTIKAYFCTPRVRPSPFGPCRIENGGFVVEEEVCPHGFACDVGPLHYTDGDIPLLAFYCRPEPGARLCGVKAPDGSVIGARDCTEGMVCDMDNARHTYDSNYQVHCCRSPRPPADVCRVENSDGDVIDEQECYDLSSCGTEGHKFVKDGVMFTNFFCPMSDAWMSPCDGRRPGGCGGRSGCKWGDRSGRGNNGGEGGRYHGYHHSRRANGGSRGRGGRGSGRGMNRAGMSQWNQ